MGLTSKEKEKKNKKMQSIIWEKDGRKVQRVFCFLSFSLLVLFLRFPSF